MADVKFFQIAPASVSPVLTDQILGVQGGSTDVLWTTQQLASVMGAGPPVTPIVSAASEVSHVIKAAPGTLYAASATNLSSIDGFLLLLNVTTVPADGAVTPLAITPITGFGTAKIDGSIICSTGIVLVLSSGINPFLKTTSGGLTGYLSCSAI